MSTGDRFEEIKRLLDSTVTEFQSLFESAGGFEDSRVGNGWNPESLVPEVYVLEPRPLPELTKKAEARKRSLFRRRFLPFLRPKDTEVQLLETPKLKLVPFWLIKGFHECFYFRGNSYRIDLPEDVVAVEVEGRIRDIIGREVGDSQGVGSLTKRILGRREWAGGRAFQLNEVTELAYLYKDGSLFVNAEGEEDLEAEAFFEKNLPLKKLKIEELMEHYPGSEVGHCSFSKQDLVRRLHGAIVRPPPAFQKILSNRFEVTTLRQYFMPLYSFVYEWRGRRRELLVHGHTGAVSR